MEPYFAERFGNPSSIYSSGRIVKNALADARNRISRILGSRPDEIYFTSGGTESDALALFGVMRTYGGTLVTSPTEHHAVLNNAEALTKEGISVKYVEVLENGDINYAELEKLIGDDVTLISLMYANNEIGTIIDLSRVAHIVQQTRKDRTSRGIERPLFLHTDACQASGQLPLDVQELGVDLMTLNGSKMYGPKGIGMLYVRKGIRIKPLWNGGGQERRLRSGTENVPGIIGFARALELAEESRVVEVERLTRLRDMLIDGLLDRIPKVVLNGPSHKATERHDEKNTQRLANNVNVSILDIEGEALLLYLDAAGIEASTGSACDSETLDPSHVILALGKPYEFAHASMRFTLGRSTTAEDITYILDVLPECAQKLRTMSPVIVDVHAKEMSNTTGFVGDGLPHWERKRNAQQKSQKS